MAPALKNVPKNIVTKYEDIDWAEVFNELKEAEEYGLNEGAREGSGYFTWQRP